MSNYLHIKKNLSHYLIIAKWDTGSNLDITWPVFELNNTVVVILVLNFTGLIVLEIILSVFSFSFFLTCMLLLGFICQNLC